MKIRNVNDSRYRGYFFWKERWFSMCSAHWEYQEHCRMCKAGHWTNDWKWKTDRLIEDVRKHIFKTKNTDGQ